MGLSLRWLTSQCHLWSTFCKQLHQHKSAYYLDPGIMLLFFSTPFHVPIVSYTTLLYLTFVFTGTICILLGMHGLLICWSVTTQSSLLWSLLCMPMCAWALHTYCRAWKWWNGESSSTVYWIKWPKSRKTQGPRTSPRPMEHSLITP